MADTVIKVENLSKKYTIGHQQQGGYKTLRDAIASSAKSLFRGLKSKSQSQHEEFWALKDVSFEVKQGEVIGIIGRNGAGKSTLLKILSRITEPTTGEIKIKGRVASLLEVGTGFHPELTGRENIFLNGAILGMSKIEIKKNFDEIVDFAGVSKFIDTPVKHFSSGMYTRLAFAVAAHLEPEILIIDEVLSVGDMAFRKKCLGKMHDIAQAGRTIIFVSHDIAMIRTLCRYAMWLEAGRVLQLGDSSKVVKYYEESQRNTQECSNAKNKRYPEDCQNLEFYVSSVEVLDTQGKHSTFHRYYETLQLIVELSGNPNSIDYSLEFRIYGELGELVAMGASGAYHNIYFEHNIKKIKIDIGPLTLTNGQYSISLSIVTGSLRVDTWNNACNFSVFDCQPFAKGLDLNDAVCVIQQSFHALS